MKMLGYIYTVSIILIAESCAQPSERSTMSAELERKCSAFMYCGYSQSSVSCFTNSTKLPEYYLDGASINIALYQSKQYNVQQQRGYKILQFTVDTNTWTPGLHLFEAKLDLRNCGSNFKQPYYSAVITKETNEGAEPLALFNCSSSDIIDPFRKASLCRVFNLVDRALDVLTCRSQ